MNTPIDVSTQKNAARKLQMTPQEKEVKRKEMKKNYKRMVREHRANNLHPDSIAMGSPHFNPQPIFPSSTESPKVSSLDMEIPEFGGTPVYIAPAVVQNPEVETPEFDAAHTIHRHRVTSGEGNALMSRCNQAFEANIGRNARGCANGKCDDADEPTHPSVVYNGNFIYILYILSALLSSLFYSKNSELWLLQMVSPRKQRFHHLLIVQAHRHNRL